MSERVYLGVDWGKKLEGAPADVVEECDKFMARFIETYEADEKDTKEKMKAWMLDLAGKEREKHIHILEKGAQYLDEYYKPNIDFSQIDPYWKHVETEKDKLMWNYFRYVIATIPHRGTIGRQIHLFLWDRTSNSVLGICRISSPTIAMKARDDFFGLKQEHKVNNMLNHIASCDVIMPLQPFGYYTGGKLMSMMLSTKDITDIYEKVYKQRIVGLETTSIYGESIQYDRLEHWKFLGLTQGFGTLQYSGISIGKIYEWLYNRYQPNFKYTEKTLRQVQAIGSLLGFPSKISTKFAIHGLQRGIYCSSLVDDVKGFFEYKKKIEDLNFTNRTAVSESNKWKERWFQRRWEKYAEERFKYSTDYYMFKEQPSTKGQKKLGEF